MPYEDKQLSTAQTPECKLSYDRLRWFRDKKPNLMPTGGWDRLYEYEKVWNNAADSF